MINSDSSAWGTLKRPSLGLMAFGSDSAWVLGGSDRPNDLTGPQNLLPGMVEFDMISRSFANLTASNTNDTGGVVKGAMQYIPSFGPEGLFVILGGSTSAYTTGLIDFRTVSVFDPVNQEWWNQTTTGSPPAPRIEFCTAGVNSTNGTYEM